MDSKALFALLFYVFYPSVISEYRTRRLSISKCKEYTGKYDFTCLKLAATLSPVTEHFETTPETAIRLAADNKTITKINDTDILTLIKDKGRNNRTSDVEQDLDSDQWIYGGEEAPISEFPHMVAIGWKNSNGSYAFDCGGSLISPTFVLTAAHCTYSLVADHPIPEVVKLGDHFIENSFNIITTPIQITIKTIHKHPQYTIKKRYNDIALLELEVEVRFNENIQPACLWSSEDLSCFPTAIATGWGAVDSYTGKRPDQLQKVTLQILSNEKCNDLLGYLINRKWDQGFLESQLCAGIPGGGKDTCQGDSGSPLQVPLSPNSNRYYIIGITSFGPRICGQEPAVYTRISSFLDWIESKVWPDEYKKWLNTSQI